MNENGSYPSVAWLKFRETIKIGRLVGNGRKRSVMATEYKGGNCSESVFLIPKGGKASAEEMYIAFLPFNSHPSGYCNDKSIFFVRTTKPKIINDVIVLIDDVMPRDLFEIESPKNKAIILIRSPNEKFETFLFLIKIECRDNEEKVVRFIRKSLIDKEIKIENGIIETMIGISENPEYLMDGFLNNLTEYIKYLSET